MSEYTKNQFHKQLDRAAEEARAMMERKVLESAFADFDFNSLQKMTPKELASWQAKYPMNSPQYIIASQEWNRRALAEQIKSVRFTTYVIAGASIIAAILGAWAGATWTKSQEQMKSPTPITQTYTPPAESKDVHQSLKKTEEQTREKKAK